MTHRGLLHAGDRPHLVSFGREQMQPAVALRPRPRKTTSGQNCDRHVISTEKKDKELEWLHHKNIVGSAGGALEWPCLSAANCSSVARFQRGTITRRRCRISRNFRRSGEIPRIRILTFLSCNSDFSQSIFFKAFYALKYRNRASSDILN